MLYLNKRILFCGLNVDCLLVNLTSYKFGSDFSQKLVRFLLEALRLNDNRFVRHTNKFAKLQFCQISRTFSGVSFVKVIFVWPEGWRSQHFQSC